MLWPLQTTEGDWLLYLTQTPFVQVRRQERVSVEIVLVVHRQEGHGGAGLINRHQVLTTITNMTIL